LVGALAGGATEACFYALDSAKVVMQMRPPHTHTAAGAATGVAAPPAAAGAGQLGVRGLLRGIAPSILFGTVPSFGSFFLCYVPLKRRLEREGGAGALPMGLSISSPFAQTLLASVVAAVPSSLAAVPCDVIKKTMFAPRSSAAPLLTFWAAFRRLTRQGGAAALLSGW
jgi:hypothetical protein